MSKPMINHRGPEFASLYQEIIAMLKEIFQTRNDIFVLSGSGTCAMEAAVGNLAIANKDQIACIANGKFGARFREIGGRYGEVIPINFDWGHSIELETVKEALEKSSPEIITMVHNETSTGILNPAKEVGKLARKHDAIFVLDCITSIGGNDVPVDELGVDIAIVGSQKCLGAPPGLAAVSVSERAFDRVKNNPQRPYYADLISYKESLPKKQTPYTPCLPLFFALHEALEIIKQEGMVERISRHKMLAKIVRAAIAGLGLDLFPVINDISDFSNTVTAVKIPYGVTDGQIREGMRNEGIIIAGGQEKLKGEIFRVATMGNITHKDVLTTIQALERVLAGFVPI
jgi:aspartate aminotransferase-like enzyme